MRVHHLNTGTMCPIGRRLVNGTGSIFQRARMVCHCPAGAGRRRLPPFQSPTGSPTRFSELYVARISGGTRTVVVAAASTAGRVPARPGTGTPLGREPRPVTVGSRSGSGSWRALLVELPDGSFGLVALPLDHVDATVQRVQVAVLIAGGAVILAFAAAGWWLSRLGLRPIAEVTSVAGAIANGERDRRVTEGVSGTEAAELARAFNRMLDERVRVGGATPPVRRRRVP